MLTSSPLSKIRTLSGRSTFVSRQEACFDPNLDDGGDSDGRALQDAQYPEPSLAPALYNYDLLDDLPWRDTAAPYSLSIDHEVHICPTSNLPLPTTPSTTKMNKMTDNISLNDVTPRASALSPAGSTPASPAASASASLSPTWRPPKAPLPPHRLAKLANALGVSTPVPANQSQYMSRSFSDSSSIPADHLALRRSPTPSSFAPSLSSYSSQVPPTSKFLLHVIPPLLLQHDSDADGDEDAPPAPNAPGYHTQFRRGTLVQVHSTLSAQLAAIAKEYALPSSAGLILYLVTSSSSTPQDTTALDEPGPRLSEDIWKHLWMRVIKAEQRDDNGVLSSSLSISSRSQTPVTPYTPRSPFLLGLNSAARSTPFLPQEGLRPGSSLSGDSQLPALNPLPTYPYPPSIPPSATSDRQAHNKSAPPSSANSLSRSASASASVSRSASASASQPSQSEPGTPDTSVDSGNPFNHADNLHLPGLMSPNSLIPILAKVEFDIDRRRAAWYEPWVRSRKANHAKRSRSRGASTNRERKGSVSGSTEGGDEERMPPIELLTGKKKDEVWESFAAAEARKQKEEEERREEEARREEETRREEEARIAEQERKEEEERLEEERLEALAAEEALREQEQAVNTRLLLSEDAHLLSESPVPVSESENDTGHESGSDSDSDYDVEATARVSTALTIRNGVDREDQEHLQLSGEEDADPNVAEQSPEYAQLPDSDSGSDPEDEDEDEMGDKTVGIATGADPLADVFGEDQDTWADIHAENQADGVQTEVNPNIVPLALTAEQVSQLPDLRDDVDEDGMPIANSITTTREEDEVMEMLAMMGGTKPSFRNSGSETTGTAQSTPKPLLVIDIPSSPPSRLATPPKPTRAIPASPPLGASSPPTKKIPPPLMLRPKEPQTGGASFAGAGEALQYGSLSPPALHTGESARLAYDSPEVEGHRSLQLETSDLDIANNTDDLDNYVTRVRSPEETGKRGGTLYEDIDLGLEDTDDFDDNDPNDRRRSQYIMSAELDEIERTLASLSPRFMNTSLGEEQSLSFNSAALSPSTPANLTLSPGNRSMDFFPPSPRLPQHPDPPEDDAGLVGQSWPAVPFSMLKNSEGQQGNSVPNSNAPPSPPRLAVNGVTTSAPRSYNVSPIKTAAGPTESERRKRLDEEEAGFYGHQTQASAESSFVQVDHDDSPVIPLSPDPFGRHPSSPEPLQLTGTQWDTLTIGKSAIPVDDEDGVPPVPPIKGRARSNTTSRFSADSLKGVEETTVPSAKPSNRTTLISVKGIRNLWRKSAKGEKDKDKAPSVGNATEAAPIAPRAPTPTAPPIPPPTNSGRSSPMVPQRPERPSEDQLYDMPPLPPHPNMGRISPMAGSHPPSAYNPQEQSRPSSRTSMDQQRGRPSLDQPRDMINGRISPNMPSPGLRPPYPPNPPPEGLYPGRRPSLEQYNGPPTNGRLSPQAPYTPPPPGLARSPSEPLHPGVRIPSGPMHPQMQQSHITRPSQDQHDMLQPPRRSLDQSPNIPGRPGPIITPYMQAAKAAANLDRLHFDQESPYPSTRRSNTQRSSPRPPSPPSLPAIPESNNNPDAPVQAGPKSIMRWKSAASVASSSSRSSIASSSENPQPRGSFERPSSSTGSSRGRRPSVINFGSTRTSVTSPDLPPSPQVPQHYASKPGPVAPLDHRTSQRSRLTASSGDSYSPPQRQSSLTARSASPPRSMASSRDSNGSRPSFDASQFEFVSPKAGTLSYPYNSLEHQ